MHATNFTQTHSFISITVDRLCLTKLFMHIGKAIYLKICEVFGKTKNKDSRDLKRHYRGRNYVIRFQDILYQSKPSKNEEIDFSSPYTTLTCV